MKPLAVIVLAGGSGTRFWPFTQDKLLWNFAGKPLVERTVLSSLPSQAQKVVFITNSLNHSFFADTHTNIPKVLVRQEESKGMADAIMQAQEHIHGYSLLIIIADDVFDAELLTNVVQTAEKTGAFGILPGWKTDTYFPGGYMVLDQNIIKKIIEKPDRGNEPSSYVTISGHFIADADTLLECMKKTTSDSDDIYERALTSLMDEYTFLIQPYESYFASLKYPWHVLPIMEYMLKTLPPYIGEHVVMKDYVTIEGPVHIGNRVKIMEYTKIVGPCYIGDNTIIGNTNVIRHSMIGANCVTGFSSDITRSYIGDQCWFHTNYIGDSVLENNISMGSGTVLANLRLDEGEILSTVKGQRVYTGRNKLGAMIGSNVRLGVNVSTMPGIKIGSNTHVGAGIVVDQDIVEKKFVVSKQSLDIRENRQTANRSRDEFRQKI